MKLRLKMTSDKEIAASVRKSIGSYKYKFDEKHTKCSGIRIGFDYVDYKYGKAEQKRLISILNQAIVEEFFTVKYFYDDSNWISYEVYQSIWEICKEMTNDKKFVYHCGKEFFRFNKGGIITLGKYLGTPQRLYKNIPKFVNKYNNQINLRVKEVLNNRATLVLSLKPLFWKRFKSKNHLVKNGCDLLKGIFEGVPTLFDYPAAESVDLKCVAMGHRSCEWKFIWKNAPLVKRLWNSIAANDYKKLLNEHNQELSNTITKLEAKLDELRDKNKEIIRYQNQLIEKEKLESSVQLISELAHDLKTPMSMVSGYAQIMMSDEVSTNQVKEYSGLISDQSRRTINIISDLLSHLKGEPPLLNKERTDVASYVEKFHSEIDAAYRGKNINVELKKNRSGDAAIDEQVFRRALYNLCKNAKEAMPGGGNILINLDSKKNHVLIKVKDSGPGVPKNMQKEIFNRFVSYKKGSSGLGLYIVKRIIEAHDGTISLKSTPKKGAVFTIKLPKI